ncbi:hypothetical protein [Palleronia caenipelagi]|uniref:Cytochrome c-552/4 domain-containing protein n=1 Tax=Palleronia caenipelagi TaxID=2489174 RepID=A0A547Q2J5_9RHOB|nr:hypothetical protein [Palleronia caenipelagi]TRD20589.1 hypothetical protein FEV53_09825 [Palleronia caenipelagi]
MRQALILCLCLPGLASADSSPWETYGSACAEAIGEVPVFDCQSGAAIPITIEGTPVTDRAPGTCDRPALLDNAPDSDGQCVPFSRILDLSTDTAQIAVMCRQKRFRSADATEYDEIDVIAHNPATGATCWFQASADESGPVSGGAVPSPTRATDGSFWQSPEAVAKGDCGVCHDNDPFMYSPFVGQVWDLVPVNPFGPYAHIDAGFGFDRWPTRHFEIRDNACTACHRIGAGQTTDNYADDIKPGSCGQLTLWMTGQDVPPGADHQAARYPGSHGMPINFGLSHPAWDVTYADSSANVFSCCLDHSQDFCAVNEIDSFLDALPLR